MIAAIREPNPVVFMFHKALQGMGGLVSLQSERLDQVSPPQNLSLVGQFKNALVDLFRGESRLAPVTGFLIEGLAKVPAGNQLVVQLDLTLDGILKVSAREKATGLLKQITIDNVLARYALAEREAAQARLNRMWNAFETGDIPERTDDSDGESSAAPSLGLGMPTLDPGPREGQRETVAARAILEKAERIKANATSEDQTELDRLMGRVRNAITDRRWSELQAATNELSDVLFYLEDA